MALVAHDYSKLNAILTLSGRDVVRSETHFKLGQRKPGAFNHSYAAEYKFTVILKTNAYLEWRGQPQIRLQFSKSVVHASPALVMHTNVGKLTVDSDLFVSVADKGVFTILAKKS